MFLLLHEGQGELSWTPLQVEPWVSMGVLQCYMHLPENACVLHVDTFNEAKDNRFLQAQKKLLRK